MGYLNVSSLRKKSPLTKELMKDKRDIQFLSEVKTDETFPSYQFEIGGYKMSLKDRNKFGGTTMFYKNENVPCRILNADDYFRSSHRRCSLRKYV